MVDTPGWIYYQLRARETILSIPLFLRRAAKRILLDRLKNPVFIFVNTKNNKKLFRFYVQESEHNKILIDAMIFLEIALKLILYLSKNPYFPQT